MRNLEYLITRESIDVSSTLCILAYMCKHEHSCREVNCLDCEFANDIELCIQTLLEEHKEPIKLTQWEKDMLETRKNLDVLYHCTLENNLYFCDLKNKGYFKNVDLSKTAEDILENCEVVENVD